MAKSKELTFVRRYLCLCMIAILIAILLGVFGVITGISAVIVVAAIVVLAFIGLVCIVEFWDRRDKRRLGIEKIIECFDSVISLCESYRKNGIKPGERLEDLFLALGHAEILISKHFKRYSPKVKMMLGNLGRVTSLYENFSKTGVEPNSTLPDLYSLLDSTKSLILEYKKDKT